VPFSKKKKANRVARKPSHPHSAFVGVPDD